MIVLYYYPSGESIRDKEPEFELKELYSTLSHHEDLTNDTIYFRAKFKSGSIGEIFMGEDEVPY